MAFSGNSGYSYINEFFNYKVRIFKLDAKSHDNINNTMFTSIIAPSLGESAKAHIELDKIEFSDTKDSIILDLWSKMILLYFHEFYLFLLTMSQVGYGDPVSMPGNDLHDDRGTWTWFILFG
tara:strand:+ start:1732 stop:2097 length:366 start_codon:yes stop_codon:yes gene_type:complete